ncbi:MAG: PIN domain-containing protein [Thiotrichaceae bacterium]
MSHDDQRILLDTNLWIYLYTTTLQSQKVKHLINKYFDHIIVSTQILGEIYHVLTRKNFQSIEATSEIIIKTVENFSVAEIGTPSVLKAIDIHKRYHYSY